MLKFEKLFTQICINRISLLIFAYTLLKTHKMRTIQVNGKEVTIQSLLNTIQSKLNLVADRHPSQYINIVVSDDQDNDKSATIRVADHSANRLNNSDETLSLVLDTCSQSYAMGCNEYTVESIEDMHTNETNSYGWLTIAEVLEDFINDLILE